MHVEPTSEAVKRLKGLALASAGGILFGLSGVAAQILLQRDGMSVSSLIAARMLGAGVLLWAWRRPRRPQGSWFRVIAFSVVVFGGVQFTFFAAIAYGNVATATLLQFLFVPTVAVYESFAERRGMGVRGMAAALGAAAGTALLVLGRGSGGIGLRITPLGLLFGLLAAAAAAIYFLASRPLVTRDGAWRTATWGFLIGSLPFVPFASWPQHSSVPLPETVGLCLFLVIGGTLLAFILQMGSLSYVRASEAAVAATLEPLVASGMAVAVLHVSLDGLQLAGGVLIIGAVVLLTGTGLRPSGPRSRPADPSCRAPSLHRKATGDRHRLTGDEAGTL